ncbi:hypothetical protein [Acidaminococcus timonensis]|uniref:hypothetical protein n=1 Tax=Acidaminococcus timonensis TaxID=1871002 RepID=UPI0008D9C0D2|nr:hypothetical protein [Acidaminococcus timonensis]
MSKKIFVTVKQSIFLNYTFTGICWIIAGICKFLHSFIFTLTALVFVSLATILSIFLFTMGQEEERDEMAKSHIMESCYRGFKVMCMTTMLSLIFAIGNSFLPTPINFPQEALLNIILGAGMTAAGLTFSDLEKDA